MRSSDPVSLRSAKARADALTPTLEQLHAALAAVSTGGGRLMVIEGAAGAGKSRLLAAAIEYAGAQGLRILRASGSELEREFAFGAVRQLFEPPVVAASLAVQRLLLTGAAAPARWAGSALNSDRNGPRLDEIPV